LFWQFSHSPEQLELAELRLGRVSSISVTEEDEDVDSVERSPVFERQDLCDEEEEASWLLSAGVMMVIAVL